MLYRKLGNTGYDISVIGFGTWQLGGCRWEDLTEQDSLSLLTQANDLGVNIFDVAVIYGQYCDENKYLQSKSQERLGNAFEHRRDKVIYCLKLGQFDEYSHRHDYEPKRIIEQFTQSLRRLKTDYIDVCLIHAPSIHKIKDEKAITILQTLQAQGYIKAIGYSFEAEPEHVLAAVDQKIDVIMLQYNLIDQECKNAIELARLHGIGILAGGTYKRGYLTGKFRSINDLPMVDDYWKWNVNLNKFKVEANLKKVNNLLAQYGSAESLREKSLHFILEHAGVSSCIIGHRHIHEVIENIKFTAQHTAPINSPNAIESIIKEYS